jgi:outer membrane protein OmpA-like peptidoglycan-associated protein
MLMAKCRESAKTKTEGMPSRVHPKVETAERGQANPLWHQLATQAQAKLTVGAPDDPYEREADAVADKVMRMPDSPSSNQKLSFSSGRGALKVQRKCAACEEEEKVQRKKSGSEADTLATIRPLVREVLNTPGDTIDSAARKFLEPRFGNDFSHVRVHTDTKAEESARAVNALAYTVGHDIIFAEGQYQPRSTAGTRLLAHELTHVMQQHAGPTSDVETGVLQRLPVDPDDEPTCADAPRHLGDTKPEVPCDAPTIKLTRINNTPQVQVFEFCLDSDVLRDASSASVAAFARRQAATATFVVHGFASIEGPEDYNQRLSCHRALRVARELMNAGVRSEQIREVSGVGKTEFFSLGDPKRKEENRAVLVLAEGGEIAPFKDPDRPAVEDVDKQIIVDKARERLIAGQYQLAADAYISFWTCGRTPTVSHAVDRLRILLPKDQKDEIETIAANGLEEDPTLGINTVRISNAALRADNPITCTMGRLVDMAFHHAVKGEAGLSPELAEPSTRALRHQAGLHLAALAGFPACTGQARPRIVRDRPAGIDAPLADDPLEKLTPPTCARTFQPTRLTPEEGAKERVRPRFSPVDMSITPNKGTLVTKRGQPSVSTTSQDVILAAATVALIGKPDVLEDYEIGFIQTIMDDLMIAEYVSGRLVVQRLPVPIRAAGTKEAAVEAPWMAPPKKQGPDGLDVVVAAGWKLQTEFANVIGFLSPARPLDLLDTWQRRTSVAVWLVARRVGAPLDRFSTIVIDGRTHDVTENFSLDFRRVPGDLLKGSKQQVGEPAPAGEFEDALFSGSFEAFQTSATPADMRVAQLGGPAVPDIDLTRQVTRILEPRALANDEGMTRTEYTELVQRILDTPEILDQKGQRAAPRLGFVFDDLTITIRFDKATGRMIPLHDLINRETGAVLRTKTDASVSVDSPAVGQVALNHLALALGLRLEKRDFLGEGRSVVLRPADIPANGELVIKLPALKKERQLFFDFPEVRQEMAEMWACSDLTLKDPGFIVGVEFARSYWVDRDGNLHHLPETDFFKSHSDGDALTTEMECGNFAGAALGSAHTHPEDSGDGPNPSVKDIKVAKSRRCGRQHFIISENFVVEYFPDGTQKTLGKREDLLPPGVKCEHPAIPEGEEE